MQSLWAGYGGLRLSDDSLQIASPPRCPPNVTSFKLRNIQYRGVRLSYEVVEGTGARVWLEGAPAMAEVQHLVISVNNAEATPLTSAVSVIPAGMTARIFGAEQLKQVN